MSYSVAMFAECVGQTIWLTLLLIIPVDCPRNLSASFELNSSGFCFLNLCYLALTSRYLILWSLRPKNKQTKTTQQQLDSRESIKDVAPGSENRSQYLKLAFLLMAIRGRKLCLLNDSQSNRSLSTGTTVYTLLLSLWSLEVFSGYTV